MYTGRIQKERAAWTHCCKPLAKYFYFWKSRCSHAYQSSLDHVDTKERNHFRKVHFVFRTFLLLMGLGEVAFRFLTPVSVIDSIFGAVTRVILLSYIHRCTPSHFRTNKSNCSAKFKLNVFISLPFSRHNSCWPIPKNSSAVTVFLTSESLAKQAQKWSKPSYVISS